MFSVHADVTEIVTGGLDKNFIPESELFAKEKLREIMELRPRHQTQSSGAMHGEDGAGAHGDGGSGEEVPLRLGLLRPRQGDARGEGGGSGIDANRGGGRGVGGAMDAKGGSPGRGARDSSEEGGAASRSRGSVEAHAEERADEPTRLRAARSKHLATWCVSVPNGPILYVYILNQSYNNGLN